MGRADFDRLVAQRKGIAYTPVTIERVTAENFHLGSRPSLIEGNAGPSAYPSVAVVADDTRPAPPDDHDQALMFTDGVYVDIVTKTTESEGEYICNARILRTADAVNNVLMRDPTLGGAVNGLSTPACFISPLFRRPANAEEGTGDELLFQVARIEYGTTRLSVF